MGQTIDNYKEQGGNRHVIGGSLDVISGGELDIESGGALKLAGVQVTATAAEINAVADVSVNGANVKVKKIAVAAGDHSTEKDSGWDLPAKSIVLDVFIDVTTLQAGKTVDVGLLSSESGGDTDGFADGLSLAAAGIVRPGVTLDAIYEAYFDTKTRGVLLSEFVQGTDTDDRGMYLEKPHLSTSLTAKSVSYQTNTTVTAVFDIYIVYIELG